MEYRSIEGMSKYQLEQTKKKQEEIKHLARLAISAADDNIARIDKLLERWKTE